MQLAILGSGRVGRTLAEAFARQGHAVVIGSRRPSDAALQQWLARGATISAATTAAAIAAADVVMLALPWPAVCDVVSDQAQALAGKIILDVSNPLAWEGGPLTAVSDSAAEQIASRLPHSRVVKIFNTIGIEHLLDSDFNGIAADMPLAGDDADAKRLAAELAAELGFRPLDAGPLRNARVLEQLAIYWIHMAAVGGLGRNIALKLIEK